KKIRGSSLACFAFSCLSSPSALRAFLQVLRTAGPRHRLFLFEDVSVARCLERRRALGIQEDEMRPLGRHIRVGKNRLDRTFRYAGIAINAMLGIDVEH